MRSIAHGFSFDNANPGDRGACGMPRYYTANYQEADLEEVSSEEEEDPVEAEMHEDGESGDEQGSPEAAVTEDRTATNGQAGPSSGRVKLKIALGSKANGMGGKYAYLKGSKDACHVCGKAGHQAGFVGSVYIDCPNKPCYLCKKPGHTTATCPHRLKAEQDHKHSGSNLLNDIFDRQHTGRTQGRVKPVPEWQVETAVLKLHTRRCTCLEFHPTKDSIVLSGDKRGHVAVWDFEAGSEHILHHVNRFQTNTLRCLAGSDADKCACTASDGKLRVFDIEGGFATVYADANPLGWTATTKEKDWVMFCGLDVCAEKRLLIAGDSHGHAHFADIRQQGVVAKVQVHKKGNKVNSVSVHPLDANVVMTGSNDWTARLSDIRCFSSSLSPDPKGKGPEQEPTLVAAMQHAKVVNSAYFSPRTGSKVLTTCIDNRIRVWDNIYALDGPPCREIVHSHDFNRYLSPFRAEWDPKDPLERLVVIGRYISEDFGGTALHPIDLFDTGTGQLARQLVDPNLVTICPVNKPHPRTDAIITGSSRSLYCWRPVDPDSEAAGETVAADAEATAATIDFLLRGSSRYVCFDADPDSGKKQKKKQAGSDDELDTPKKKRK